MNHHEPAAPKRLGRPPLVLTEEEREERRERRRARARRENQTPEEQERRRAQQRTNAKAWRARNPELAVQRNKEWHAANPEKSAENARKRKRKHYHAHQEQEDARKELWRRTNMDKWLWWRAKNRAAKAGLAFDITVEDVRMPDSMRCPVLDIPLVSSAVRPSDSSPSIDRRDNSLGYVKGNVRVISHRANRLKSDATLDELQKIVDYMQSLDA